MTSNTKNNIDIAIIGMGCRFPKATNPEEFWQLLHDGIDCVTEFTKDDLKAAGIDPLIIKHPLFVNKGMVLENYDTMDASFFGLSPRDAEIMDPQHRIFLECSWEALENAGYDAEKFEGLVGVYGGTDSSSYLVNIYLNPELLQSVGMFTVALHNDKDSLTTRVAYKLNLKGPAVTVQTTCSTSLVAVIHACQSLLNYQCDMALAGGSSISLPQRTGYFINEREPYSKDGHTRVFDADASGTIPGSGVGVVVLKRLEDALADGDHIEAVIRGFGVNNDGSDKTGFTARGLQEAIAMAGISVDDITYVEAHGTGSKMYDPIEVDNLTQVFRNGTSRNSYCGIGSVKTNIGHCHSAAGVAGLIKTVLSLKNKMLPPSLHFARSNSHIDFPNSPFYVVNSLRPWEEPIRKAVVSSFGIGGTHAHVVIEEAPELIRSVGNRCNRLLVLSARSAGALDRMCDRLQQYLLNHPDLPMSDVAYTLQTGRKRFAHRRMYVLPQECRNLQEGLQITSDPEHGAHSHVVFLFPGQGSQYPNMGKGLYEQEILFRQIVDDCCDKLKPLLGLDLRTLLFSDDPDAAPKLKQTAIAQPALFVISYATARLWMSWGVLPEAMIGHSIGELAAACIADVFSLSDALKLVAARGRLMQSMPPGAMVAVHIPLVELQPLLDSSVSVAAINTPSSCVISGTFDSITNLEQQLDKHVISYQRLITSHAFHSAMMDPIIEPFTRECESIALKPPEIPFLSNITGRWISPQETADPAYWGKQIRAGVQFSVSIGELLKNPFRTYIETGPGNSLCTLLYQHYSKREGEIAFPSLPHPKDTQPDVKLMTASLGRLWMAGVDIHWKQYYQEEKRKKVSLPTYPFEHERYWIDPLPGNGQSVNRRKEMLRDWLYVPCWTLLNHDILDTKPSLLLNENGGSNGNGHHHDNGLGSWGMHTSLLTKKNWIVLDNGSSTGDALIQALVAKENKVWRIRKGDEFLLENENNIVIGTSNREQFAKALKMITDVPDVILHLWNFRSGNEEENAAHPETFYSLLYFIQELVQQHPQQNIRLKVIASEMHSLNEIEVVNPFNALLVGACKVIGQEFPLIRCQAIDMELPSGKKGETSVIQNIFQEIYSDNNDEQIIYRNGKRWVRTFRIADIGLSGSSSILKKNGVYLITGGLGGVGLQLAKYLGKRYKAKLILTGRSQFPDCTQWDRWLLENDANDPVSCKIIQFQKLQELGAEVITECVDVTDIDSMRLLRQRIDRKFGSLNGIIHSAGIAGGGIIAVKKDEHAEKVMDPKVRGTLNLERIFSKQQLDFFMLCSSLSAIVGGVGQIDYCAANNFLDAFAHQHYSRLGTRYISVNWDTWGEVGMAVNTEVPEELKQGQQEALRNGIKNAEGMELFEKILTGRFPQVLISTSDLLNRIKGMASQQMLVQQSSKKQQSTKLKTIHDRPKMSTTYEPASNDIEQKLTEIWMDLLGLEKVGVNDNFLELGGHSLLAIQLSSRLRSAFHIEFSVQSFFESPTIRSVAAMMRQQNENGEAVESEKLPITRLSRDKYRVENIPTNS